MSVEAAEGIVVRHDRTTSFAGGQILLRAVGTGIYVRVLIVGRFVLRQLSAAVLTSYRFHDLCYRVIKLPRLIETDKIEDVKRAPLVFVEVEIRDSLHAIFPNTIG